MFKKDKLLALLEQGSYSLSSFIFYTISYFIMPPELFVQLGNTLMLAYVFIGFMRAIISIPMMSNHQFDFGFYLCIFCIFLIISNLVIYLLMLTSIELLPDVQFVAHAVLVYEFIRRTLYRLESSKAIKFLPIIPIASLILLAVGILIDEKNIIYYLYFLPLYTTPLILLMTRLPKIDKNSYMNGFKDYVNSLNGVFWNFLSSIVYSIYSHSFFIYMSGFLTVDKMAVIYFWRSLFQPIQIVISAADSIDKNLFRKAENMHAALKILNSSILKLSFFGFSYVIVMWVIALLVDYIGFYEINSWGYSVISSMSLMYILMAVGQPVESILVTRKFSKIIFQGRVVGVSILIFFVIVFGMTERSIFYISIP